MITFEVLVSRLITLSIESKLISSRDSIYARNRILSLFKVNEYTTPDEICTLNLYETLDALADVAISKGLIEDSLAERDCFTSAIMDVFLPSPQRIEDDFWRAYEKSPTLATSHFYQLSQSSNYIKMNRIAKNVEFKADSPYGPLDITINLSKQEKDTKEMARLKNEPASNYTRRLRCIEKEGEQGGGRYE